MNFATNAPPPLWVPALATFVIAVALVRWVRAFALRHAVLDVPSARSSHTAPTPRGGGIGIVVAQLLVALTLLGAHGRVTELLIAQSAALVLMVTGWLDDRRSLPVGTRFTVHVIAGAALIPIAWATANGAPWATAWTLLWAIAGVAAINLVNFMDGIDGLVGTQATVIALYLALMSTGTARVFAIILACACLGFLVWNWAPASIFMGDAGSGPLGLLLMLALILAVDGQPARVVPLALPFVPMLGDAVLTLARRAWRREQITESHRTHLYQRMANGGLGHAGVAAMYAALTLSGCGVGLVWARQGPVVGLVGAYLAALSGLVFWLARRYPLDGARPVQRVTEA